MQKFLAVILGLGMVLAASAGPSDPEPRTDGDWPQRHERFVNHTLANPQIPILFYGDSIMRRWLDPSEDGAVGGRPIYDQLYAPLGVANYGIGGDQVQHVLWRVINGEVQGLSPKLVLLKIGTNNLHGGHTNTEIAQGIATLVNTLKQLVPSAKILLLGIFPRNGNDHFENIADINGQIARLHDGRQIFYLDMFGTFAERWGSVHSALFIDGLHLSLEGYQKWADTMGPLFNQLVA